MKRVVIESPYAGQGTTPQEKTADIERNLRYLRACMHDCFRRGEAPFASHGLYTQPGVLRDSVPIERDLGIRGGFVWRDVAELTVVYTDLGMSGGMKYGIADADQKGRPIEYRQLGDCWDLDIRATYWWGAPMTPAEGATIARAERDALRAHLKAVLATIGDKEQVSPEQHCIRMLARIAANGEEVAGG